MRWNSWGWLGVWVGLVLVAVFLMGWFSNGSQKPEQPADVRIENVTRVFMHDVREYSFLVQVGESTKRTLIKVQLPCCEDNDVVIFADVPAGQKMWAVAKRDPGYTGKSSSYIWVKSLEIHIRTEKDLEGAGWVRRINKSDVHGTTNVLD